MWKIYANHTQQIILRVIDNLDFTIRLRELDLLYQSKTSYNLYTQL
jgi:hypothetical protein